MEDSAAVIPEKHIDYLRHNPSPDVLKVFESRYGEGSAERVLRELRQEREAQQAEGEAPLSVTGDIVEGVTSAPRLVAEGGVQGFAVAPAKILQNNFGDVQFDVPVTLFDEDGEFDPQWSGFNWQVMTSDEFKARSAAGEKTGLDELTDDPAGSVTGSAIKGIAQFTGAYIGLGKFFKLGKGLVGATTSGAATDFLGFEGDDGRMVDALEEMGVEIPLVTSWLRTEKEDHNLTGRLKNSIEGAGIGFAVDGVMKALRGLRAMRRGEEGAKEAVEEGLEEIKGAAKEVEDAKVKEEAEDEHISAVEEVEKARKTETEVPEGEAPAPEKPEFKHKLTPKEAEAIREATILRSNQPLARRPDLRINMQRTKADPDTVDLMASQQDVLSKQFADMRAAAPHKWAQVKKQADRRGRELARMSDVDPAEFAKQISKGFDKPEDMAAELYARWNLMMTVEEEVKTLARKIEDGADASVEAEFLRHLEIGNNLLIETQNMTSNVARSLAVLNLTRKSDDGIRNAMRNNAVDGLPTDAKVAARAINEARKAGESAGKVTKIAREAIQRGRRVMDDINTFRINAMLSGPGTQEVNFVGNALNMVLLPVEQALGGSPVHAARTVQGMIAGAIDSVHTGLRTFWNEDAYLDPFNARLEGEVDGRLASSKSVGAKIVRMPSRFMMAADEMFKQSAYRGRIFADAVYEAKARKLTGKERKEFIDNYVRNSFDADGSFAKGDDGKPIRADAMLQARRTTFTEGMDEEFIRSVMRLADRWPVLRLFMPFIRTPVNILSQGFQHLPAVGLASKRFQRDMAAGGWRRSQAIGRQVMGTSLVLMGLVLASNGMITGSGPKDHRARSVWLKNNRPYSIRWKDDDGKVHHWEYHRMEPLSTVLAIFADFAELADDEETMVDLETSELLGGIVLSVAENTVNKTFTQGLFDLMTMMTDPEGRGASGPANLLGSFVPNVIPQVQDDPMFREIRNMEDQFLNRLGMDGIDPKRNILGEISYRPGRKWDPLQLTQGDAREVDEVMLEIQKLGDRYGSNFDIPRAYKINGNDIREIPFEGNPDQSLYDRRLELSGTIKMGGRTLRGSISRLIKSSRWKLLRDGTSTDNKGPKYKYISQIIRRYREAADRQLLRESETYKGLKTGLKKAIRTTRRYKTLEEAINE